MRKINLLVLLLLFSLATLVGCADNTNGQQATSLKLSSNKTIMDNACPEHTKCHFDVEACKNTLSQLDSDLEENCTEDQLKVVYDCAIRSFVTQSCQMEQRNIFHACAREKLTGKESCVRNGFQAFESREDDESGHPGNGDAGA